MPMFASYQRSDEHRCQATVAKEEAARQGARCGTTASYLKDRTAEQAQA